MDSHKHPLRFHSSLLGLDPFFLSDNLIHILCRKGSFSLTQQGVRFNVVAGTYTILPNPSLVSDIHQSEDFDGIILTFPFSFTLEAGLRNNYGAIGQASLLLNPVMVLDDADFEKCQTMLELIRKRSLEGGHRFSAEMIGYLLNAHILDLYDIHSRIASDVDVSGRAAVIMREFFRLLDSGLYLTERAPCFYADRICISVHYLSDICRRVSGNSANYWIDRFTVNEITHLLRDTKEPLSKIAETLNFTSLSYFRDIQKKAN